MKKLELNLTGKGRICSKIAKDKEILFFFGRKARQKCTGN